MSIQVFPFDTGAGSISSLAGTSVAGLGHTSNLVSAPQRTAANVGLISGNGVNNAKAASSSSGNSVQKIVQAANTQPTKVVDNWSQALNLLQNIADSNTAKSVELANAQNNWQVEQNAKAMAFSQAEAEKDRKWQEYMSNTAHQREVQDLLAAGLNPVLSAMGGNGASVGSGATAQAYTSSGSKGTVDTSVNSSIAGFLSSLLNAATSINVANINAATSIANNKLSLATSLANNKLTNETNAMGNVGSLVGNLLSLIPYLLK